MTQADRYIHGHAWGTVAGLDRDLPINDQTVEDMKAGFEVLTSEGFYPPILRAHLPDTDSEDEAERQKALGPRAVRDGFTYGRVVDVLSSKDPRAQTLKDDPDIPTPDKGGVWYGIKGAEGMDELIDKGYIDQWSPSVYRNVELPHPEMADQPLEAIPRHLAFVSQPHQKNLEGSPHYKDLGEPVHESAHVISLGDDLFVTDKQAPITTTEEHFPFNELKDAIMGNEKDEQAANLEELAGTVDANTEALDDLGQAVDDIAEAIDSMSESMDLGEDDDVDPEVARLQDQISDLEGQVESLRKENEELKKGRLEDLADRAGFEDEEVEEIVELAEDDPFKVMSKLVNKEKSAPSGSRPPKGGSGTPTQNFADEGEKKRYIEDEYDVVRGSEAYVQAYKQEFSEDPYAQ